MIKCFLDRNLFLSVALLLTVLLSLSSCDTLKKKFTRTKKGTQESQDFQPVLEPQEYPAPENNPVEIYKQHYSLIKVWYKDLWAGIEEGLSDAMVKNSIKQILDQVDQMKTLFPTDKAKSLDQLKNLLYYYKDALEQNRNFRNYSRIQSDLRAFDRTLRDHFGVDAVKGDFSTQ